MTVLLNHQFEILASDTATDGFVFGNGASVSVEPEGFDSGENSWIVQDAQNTRRGNIGFGRDVLAAKTWAWESYVNEDDVESAVATLQDFSAAWEPADAVLLSGATLPLRYRLAGRDRRVYGRPRRFAAPPTNLILNGYVDVTHDFQLVDAHTYDDLASSVEIPFNSTVSGGGFVIDGSTTWPVSTIASEGNGGGAATVGGNAKTYPVIRFHGTWTNPSITSDAGWTLTWQGSLVGDAAYVEIDARPWALTVLDQSGASRAGGLDRTVYLEDIWFAPNTTPQFALDGVAPTGNAGVTITWRNAWTSL